MYKATNRKIVSILSCFLLLCTMICLPPPGTAEAAQAASLSAAKGYGFANLAQRWCNKYIKKVYAQKYEKQKEVLGYYTKDGATDNLSQNSLQAKADKITGIATFSYQVTPTGQISGKIPAQALETAWDNNIETLALIHNLSPSGFDRTLIHSILSNPNLRFETISNIYKTLLKNGFDGVNIDFENVPAEDRQNLNKFMTELKDKLHPDGFKVTISVPAKTADSPNSGWGAAFDYKELAQAVDRIMLMAYDEHYFGGHPGPVASTPWVEKVVVYAAQEIPKEKIILGIGNYGYDWVVNRGGYRSVPSRSALTLAQKYGASVQWDNANQTPYFYYWDNKGQHVVWYESTNSAAFKLDLVNNYDLKGIAIWRLGFEAPEFWNTVEAKLNGQK